MLAGVKRVFPEDGSVGQDGTVTAWGKTGQWGGPSNSMDWPTITENRPSTKSTKISFSTLYSIAIVRCQNIFYNVVNGFYYTQSIEQDTVPLCPI